MRDLEIKRQLRYSSVPLKAVLPLLGICRFHVSLQRASLEISEQLLINDQFKQNLRLSKDLSPEAWASLIQENNLFKNNLLTTCRFLYYRDPVY